MDKLDLEGKIDLGNTMLIWRAINVPESVFELIERDSTMANVSYVAYVPDHICMVDGLPRCLDKEGPFAPDHTTHLPYKEGTLVVGYH